MDVKGSCISEEQAGMLRRSLMAFIGTIISITIQNFHAGISNNVFHIMIMNQYFVLEQFRDDDTVQSLKNFVAPLYHVLAIFDFSDDMIVLVFLFFHALTRWGLYFLIMRASSQLSDGDDTTSDLMVLFVLLSSVAFGYSPLGVSGLQINYFTHSELALTIALWALDRLRDGRFLQAAWIIALLALTNAFKAVWVLAPFVATALHALLVARTVSVSTLAAASLAILAGLLPITLWVLVGSKPFDAFDYREFLRLYFPHHMLFDWANRTAQARAGAIALAACILAPLLPRSPLLRFLFLTLPLVLLFGVGIAAGELVDNRMVLNLHLLRVDGLLILLACALFAAALTVAVTAGHLLGLGASAAFLLGLMRVNWQPWSLVAASVALLLSVRLAQARPISRLRIEPRLAAALLLPAYAVIHADQWVDHSAARPVAPGAPPRDRELVGIRPKATEWADLKSWVRNNTDQRAVFLVPLKLEDFRIGAQRRIWVDWKEGARVMWAPWTYAAWRERYTEVSALRTVTEMAEYARQRGIDAVVIDRRVFADDQIRDAPITILYENRWFVLARPS